MSERVSIEAKVGLFVLAGLILLAYMSLKVGKFEWGRGKGARMSVLFENVSGLKKDAPVEIAGIEVGRIEEITLDKNQARVHIRLKPGIKLSYDSLALIRTKGVLGDKFIELVPGDPSGTPIKDGGVITQARTQADIDQLVNRISAIAGDVQDVSRSLRNVLGTAEGERSLKETIANILEITRNLNQTIRENYREFGRIIANVSTFSKDMSELSGTNKQAINQIIDNMAQASVQLEKTLRTVSDISQQVGKGRGTLGKLVYDDQLITDLNRSMAALRSITEEINQGKGTIGKLVKEDKAAQALTDSLASVKSITGKIDEGKGTIGKLVNDETTVEKLNDTLSGINRFLSRTESFQTHIDYRGEYLAKNAYLKSYLNLRLQPKQDKYYILGLVDDPYGKRTVTNTTVTTVSGGTKTVQTITEDKTEKNQLKFNAMVAKRYFDLTVRGGIIESTGGFGMDYHLLKDRLKLSLEAYNFDPDYRPHLKASASYGFFKHLFVTAGYDDFVSDRDRQSFFVGGGIRFQDEDLKYLLGSVPLPK
jgi:phospholipid/cholesterol/gamma-HCH transport system substrate-binding protein